MKKTDIATFVFLFVCVFFIILSGIYLMRQRHNVLEKPLILNEQITTFKLIDSTKALIGPLVDHKGDTFNIIFEHKEINYKIFGDKR